MKLEQDIKEIKGDIWSLKNKEFPQPISRPGLYLLVAIGTLSAIGASQSAGTACEKLEELKREIKTSINEIKPELKVENVIGNEEPETFYEINGERAYLKINGKPVDSYFTKPERLE